MSIINHIKDRISGKVPKGRKRSSKWRKVRKEYLKKHPECELCGSTTRLEVHHIKDFSSFPALELEWFNLMTLCRTGGKHGMGSCHYAIGHFGNWKDINDNIIRDVTYWNTKFNRSKK